MSKAEFVLLIPGLIYGVALVDLLKIFRSKIYIETFGWGLVVFLSVIFTWINIFERIDFIVHDRVYLVAIIIQSVYLAKISTIITPEERDSETDLYFQRIQKPFFLACAGFTLYLEMLRFLLYDDFRTAWIRPLFAVLLIAMAYLRNKASRLIILAFIIIIMLLSIINYLQ